MSTGFLRHHIRGWQCRRERGRARERGREGGERAGEGASERGGKRKRAGGERGSARLRSAPAPPPPPAPHRRARHGTARPRSSAGTQRRRPAPGHTHRRPGMMSPQPRRDPRSAFKARPFKNFGSFFWGGYVFQKPVGLET